MKKAINDKENLVLDKAKFEEFLSKHDIEEDLGSVIEELSTDDGSSHTESSSGKSLKMNP